MAGKTQVQQELQLIGKILERFPRGASFEQIYKDKELKDLLTERTLRRRLGSLLEQGVIRVTGQTRSAQYHLVRQELQTPVTATSGEETKIPLSPEAQSIRHLISQPLGNRPPTSYDQDFLRRYISNKTYYLSEKDRKMLHELGRTAQLAEPAGTYARKILERLLIDLSYNSSRLEGNNYSLLDTKRLISEGRAADQRTAEEAQMILNHKAAIEFVVESAADIGFNRYTITNLHGMLSDNLLGDPAASGRLRSIAVDIGGSVYVPLAIPQLIDGLFTVLLQKASEIEDPFEQSFFVMVQLPYLQPFDDVNKRVSRLAGNIPLIKQNLAPLSFVDVPKELYAQGLLSTYELKRTELFRDVFLWAYERSAQRYAALRQSMGAPDEFRLKYRQEIKGLVREVIVHEMNIDTANSLIGTYAEGIPTMERAQFREVVDTELLSIHEGNFARYGVTPLQFDNWQRAWARK
jgi:Fic family protein